MPKDFEEYRALVSKQISTIRDPAWLAELYKVHTERFKTENDRIWETGKIFLPLSFAAFGAFAQLKDRGWLEALIFGGASTCLLAAWHLIALTHRYFQDIHSSWTSVIEAAGPLNVQPQKAFPNACAKEAADQTPAPAPDGKAAVDPPSLASDKRIEGGIKRPPKRLSLNFVRFILIFVVGAAWAAIGTYLFLYPAKPGPAQMDVNLKKLEVKVDK